ncbi:hypothetical protein ABZP36_008301 [Zizania latifolia]
MQTPLALASDGTARSFSDLSTALVGTLSLCHSSFLICCERYFEREKGGKVLPLHLALQNLFLIMLPIYFLGLQLLRTVVLGTQMPTAVELVLIRSLAGDKTVGY